MNILKRLSIIILSGLLISITGALSVSSTEITSESTSGNSGALINIDIGVTTSGDSYEFINDSITIDGVKYSLVYDADPFNGIPPGSAVLDIYSKKKVIKTVSEINYKGLSFGVSHCNFTPMPSEPQPKCKKTCKKIILPGMDYAGGFYNWKKLEQIVVGKNATWIGDIKNCKNLKSIKILSSNLEYLDNIKGCKKLSKITINNTKKSPIIKEGSLKNNKKGIKFVVKNKKVAKQLKKELYTSGVKKAKILIGKKVIYKNIDGIYVKVND